MFGTHKTRAGAEKQETVECEDCGCVISLKSAHTVTRYPFIYIYEIGTPKTYYCGRCKPPYDEIHETPFARMPYTYSGRVAMDSDGTPVGFTKDEPCSNPVLASKSQSKKK